MKRTVAETYMFSDAIASGRNITAESTPVPPFRILPSRLQVSTSAIRPQKPSAVVTQATPLLSQVPTSTFQLSHFDPTSSTSPAAMGKVHGSLARAGKVKSATPKVSFPFLSFHVVCVGKGRFWDEHGRGRVYGRGLGSFRMSLDSGGGFCDGNCKKYIGNGRLMGFL